MKKLNKKGFTLAELLIVIAIIAILIAIAIPAFSASLYSARLQTDHANIRAAYAMARTADMLGVIDLGAGEHHLDDTTEVFYFEKDGTISNSSSGDHYTLQVTANGATPSAVSDDCDTSIVCKSFVHEKGKTITIKHSPALGWHVETGAAITITP